jgi:hypothetical protein
VSEPKTGDLRVWWIPQIPGKPFYVAVASVREAKLILDTLGAYDAFQYENRIKPDYSNAGGLECYQQFGSGDFPDWGEWEDPETGECIDECEVPA